MVPALSQSEASDGLHGGCFESVQPLQEEVVFSRGLLHRDIIIMRRRRRL